MKKIEKLSSVETGGCTIYNDERIITLNEYSVQLDSSVVSTYKYADLIYLLDTARDTDSFNIKLQNFGGSCHACVSLVNVMKTTPARVTCEVIGPCYSAGTTIALAGDNLVMHPNALLMFHDFSTVAEGKSCEIELNMEQSKKWIHGYMLDYHRPFLTLAECNNINKGKDLYIHSDDATLEARLNRHFKELKPVELRL